MLKRALLASAGAVAMSAGLAMAQTGTPEASGNAAQGEEIIVTSERRSARLQDVPVAVSAYTSETRQIIGLDNLREFTNFTPGLSFQSAEDRVFIRGIGRQTNTNGSDPGVAIYVDGVYNARTAGVSTSDFFVQRVEVLRGPQGTLYGRNSIGGAINAISKRPTEEFSGELRGAIGDYGVRRIEAAVSGTLAEGLRARVGGGYYDQEEGYFTNLAGGRSEGGAGEQRYLELQLEADLNEDLNVWVKAFTNSADSRPRTENRVGPWDYAPYPTSFIAPGSAFGLLLPGVVQLGSGVSNPGQDDIRNIDVDTEHYARVKGNYGLAVEATWDLGGVDLKYIGGLQEYTTGFTEDVDGTSVLSYTFPLDPVPSAAPPNCAFLSMLSVPCTPLTVLPSQEFGYLEKKTFGSSEVTLSSNDDGPLQWIAGAYYYAEKNRQEAHFTAPDQLQLRAPIDLLGAPAAPNPSGDFVTAESTLETRSWALFGQATWKLTETLSVTAGLRYSRDEKEGEERFRIICFGCAAGATPDQLGSLTPAIDLTPVSISYAAAPGVASAVRFDPATGLYSRDLSGSWSATTGTLGVEWRPDADTLVFARYGRGYKSGGFNAGAISALPETGAEYVDSYEIGYKATIDRALTLNAAAFFYDYDGLQVPLKVTLPGGGPEMTQFFNLDRSRSWGVELEAMWRATDDLRFLLSYGYGDSEITEACCFVDGVDPLALQPGAQPVVPTSSGEVAQSLVGQQLPQIPRHKVALNAVYTFHLEGATLDISASYVWKDSMYHGVFNRAYTQTPSFDQVDLRAIWTDATDSYRVIGFVKNVFDTVGYDNASGDMLATFPTAAPGSYSQVYSFTPPRTVGLQIEYRF